VTVSHNGTVLFTDSLNSGEIIKEGNFISLGCAVLIPNATVANVCVNLGVHSTGVPGTLTGGLASVRGTFGPPGSIPEPGTLEGLLLGMGVLGLPGLARRKLKLGT
jgi:hypothetical protein